MGKEDIEGILGGLKNAIERGSDIEKAISTFVNAGYSQEDIDEAIKQLPENAKKNAKILSAPSAQSLKQDIGKPLPEIPRPESIKPKKKGVSTRTVLIGAAIIIFVLIVVLVGTMVLMK
jgi:hypothetical protein